MGLNLSIERKKMLNRPIANKKKIFSVADWQGQNEGEKILIYGDSGIGKTTLAALATVPVFIGVDDGGRKLVDPVTGERLKYIPDVCSFGDVRDALTQPNLFKDYKTIVIDNVTELQRWALPYTFATVMKEKGGVAKNVEDYGWHKGYRHWYDVMHLILPACDTLVRQGKNIIFVAQASVINRANPEGEDFLREGPELYHDSKVSILNDYVSWCDHVFRLNYTYIAVKDEKATSACDRAVFTHPEIHYTAKSRTLPIKYKVISFNSPKDDSVWKILFGGKK